MKWYIVHLDDGQKLVFQARELSYVYQGHAVFQDVVMSDCKMKAYYIPVERIVFVMEDVEGEIIEEAKQLINV